MILTDQVFTLGHEDRYEDRYEEDYQSGRSAGDKTRSSCNEHTWGRSLVPCLNKKQNIRNRKSKRKRTRKREKKHKRKRLKEI